MAGLNLAGTRNSWGTWGEGPPGGFFTMSTRFFLACLGLVRVLVHPSLAPAASYSFSAMIAFLTVQVPARPPFEPLLTDRLRLANSTGLHAPRFEYISA